MNGWLYLVKIMYRDEYGNKIFETGNLTEEECRMFAKYLREEIEKDKKGTTEKSSGVGGKV